MHPMYERARGLVGQPVYVHCYGRVHYGVLHRVTTDGIFVRPVGGATMSYDTSSESKVALAPMQDADKLDVEDVFLPLFFFPFAAMAAFGPWWWW